MWGFWRWLEGEKRVHCGGLHLIPHISQHGARGYQCGCGNIHTCVRVTQDVTSVLSVGPLHWARFRSVKAAPDPSRPQPRTLVCVEIIIADKKIMMKNK